MRKMSQGSKEVKVIAKVDVPECLEFHGRRYEVIGVLTHHGRRVDRGHYTIFTKSANQWWHCNDHVCHKVMDNCAMFRAIRGATKFTGYVLIYKAI